VHDLTYDEAIEAAPTPHLVLLGPVPCRACGAWVEWAGAGWLALGTQERHDCAPYLAGRIAGRIVPRSMVSDQAHQLTQAEATPEWLPGQQALAIGVGVLLVLLILALAYPPAR
jgi:hypothetical protein